MWIAFLLYWYDRISMYQSMLVIIYAIKVFFAHTRIEESAVTVNFAQTTCSAEKSVRNRVCKNTLLTTF